MRETGLEPVRTATHAPQTCASADSATLAFSVRYRTCVIIAERNTDVNSYLYYFFIFTLLISIDEKSERILTETDYYSSSFFKPFLISGIIVTNISAPTKPAIRNMRDDGRTFSAPRSFM